MTADVVKGVTTDVNKGVTADVVKGVTTDVDKGVTGRGWKVYIIKQLNISHKTFAFTT